MAEWSYASVRESVRRTTGEATRVFRVLAAQPGWVMRLAVTLAAIMVIVIALLLIVPAIAIFLLVIGASIVVTRLGQGLRSVFPGAGYPNDSEGRKNVRVLARREE